MAWNEPGGNNKDPWGNRRNDGPPDIDEVFRKLNQKLKGILGGGRGGGGQGGNESIAGLGILFVVVAVIVWAISGIYIVDEGERGVVLQFGEYKDITLPGPHWILRPIQSVEKVNVSEVRSIDAAAQVLTGDENIVNVKYTVQFNIKDPAHYLFKVVEPRLTLRQAAESAFREVIGKNTLDYVIQDGRDEVSVSVKGIMQDNIDLYETGIEVSTVNLIESQPPQEVQGAFEDAIKAREDKDRYIKESEAYRNEIIPVARGNAQTQIEEAKAYEFRITKSAEGETARFLQLLAEYEKAPKVTRDRLYLQTIETVFANSGKVVVDIEGGNNLMYLPLDKIMQGRHNGRVTIEPTSSGSINGRSQSGFSGSGRSRAREGR